MSTSSFVEIWWQFTLLINGIRKIESCFIFENNHPFPFGMKRSHIQWIHGGLFATESEILVIGCKLVQINTF